MKLLIFVSAIIILMLIAYIVSQSKQLNYIKKEESSKPKSRVFETSHGTLFVFENEYGFLAKDSHGRKQQFNIDIEDVNEALAPTILMCIP